MDDLVERAASLAPGLKRCGPEKAAEALRHYVGGKSVYHAAREAGVSERHLREWVRLLGIKRSDAEAMAMRRAAGRAAAALHLENQREAAALRRAAAFAALADGADN